VSDAAEPTEKVEPDDRIRVAVVGLGIGRMHVLAFAELRAHYRVVAVCDVDADRAAEVAGWLTDVRAETDPAAIWAADDVDVVSICTPPVEHRAHVEAALRAGKDVIAEKPLVGSVRQVDELVALTEETGHHVMPIFQYRFGNGLQRLKALVDQGLAGRPYVTNIDLAWTRGADYFEVPWRGRWETELGGVLTTHAVHLLDMAVHVLGPPAAVWCRMATLVNDVETEDSAAVSLRWADGSLATLSATLGSAVEISRHRFTFANVTAESGTDPYYSSFDPWVFTPAAGHDEEITAALEAYVPGTEDYIGQFDRYAAARRSGGALPVTLADARLMLELVTAMYRSARTDREVALPLASDDPMIDGWAP
jgi:predicted dehydrogenase